MSCKILSVKPEPQTIFSLENIKTYLRISDEYDNGWILELIDAAISAAENFLRITIIEKTVHTRFDSPYEKIKLPLIPVSNVIAVNIHKEEHEILLSQDEYEVHKDILLLKKPPSYNFLSVKYIAGYKNGFLPASVKQGIMLHIAQMYDSRGTNSSISTEMQSLYQPFRRIII